MFDRLSDFHAWLDQRRQASDFAVWTTPLESMNEWKIDPRTGDVTHRTGCFFSIRGLAVTTDHRHPRSWSQPIIVQPEIGILGILVRNVRGIPCCLLQAKMEPGNIGLVQLSPTVQATRSNFTRVHRGSRVPYLEHFTDPRNGHLMHDVLQSEQGSWFLNKRNRNMIVEVSDDVPASDDFCWLSLGLISDLLKEPNLVNMDSRSVLSGMPFSPLDCGGKWRRQAAGTPLHTSRALLSWLTRARTTYSLTRQLVPLTEIPGWTHSAGEIVHEEGRYFSIIGVNVHASSREVGQWSQPMLRPCGPGVTGFLGRHINGVFHLLVHAETAAGTRDVVEIAPTVSCTPANYAAGRRPRYLDELERTAESDTLVDVVHSEEGGRFFHAQNRYVVVDVGEGFDLDVPDDFCWMTVNQLGRLAWHGDWVNVEARSLLSCLAVAS